MAGGADPGPGIFWWHGSEGLRPCARCRRAAGTSWSASGQEHKVGIHNAKAGLMALENAGAASTSAPRPVAHRWSAQNYRGADGLPYIGRDAAGCFIATGFATDGLTWGTVAARLIAAELLGHEAPRSASSCKPGPLLAGQGRARTSRGERHRGEVSWSRTT